MMKIGWRALRKPGAHSPRATNNVGTLIVSAAGQIEFCDPGAAYLFRSSPCELVMKAVATFVPDLPRPAGTRNSSQALRQLLGRRVAWRRCEGRDGSGNAVPLEVLSMSASAESAGALWLVLRRADAAQEA